MKFITLLSLLFLCFYDVEAQKSIIIKGQLLGHEQEQTYYSRSGKGLAPLSVSLEGNFELEIMSGVYPTYFTLNTISKRGKINSLFPILWLGEEDVMGIFDLEKRTIQTQNITPYQHLSEKIESTSNNKRVAIISENLNEIPSLYFLNLQKEKLSLNVLEEILERVDPEYRDHSSYRQMDYYVRAKRFGKVKMGNKISDFTLPNAADEQESILSNNGKTKLIALLSSGCSFSLASISLLDQLQQINEGNLEQISIWDDKDKNTWLNYRSDLKKKISWKNLRDENNFASTYFNNKSWPTFYVVSHEGVLIDKFNGYNKRTAKKLKLLVKQ